VKSSKERSKKVEKEIRARENLMKMLITMCILYLFGNLPLAISEIQSVYQINIGISSEFSAKFSYFTNTCLFVYRSSDFYVYYIFNKQFRDGFKSMISYLKSLIRWRK
jgi:hypothetical protein